MADPVEFVHCGLTYSSAKDGTKFDIEVYQGPAGEAADVAYNTCRIIRDGLVQGSLIGAVVIKVPAPYYLPASQKPF